MQSHVLHQILMKAEQEAVVFGVDLFNWGEPFTHPDLPAMVRMVNSMGMMCNLSTNLNSDRNLSGVLAEEPHSIRISCSGFTQGIYGRTHTKGDIERVKLNMVEMAYRRTKKTRVYMLWHQYHHNWHEEPMMRAFCQQLGFEFETVPAYYMPLETVLDVWEGKQALPALDENLLTGLMEHKRLCGGRKMACRNQTQEITIDAAGMVQLCCGVYDSNKFTLCRYLDVALEDIQHARFNHSFCGRCANAGGHIYVTGYSHDDPGMVRSAAKAVYRRVAPFVPKAVLKAVV
jgi:MoaA/NifB/PqqE/SkfB family radical SAM enzyme